MIAAAAAFMLAGLAVAWAAPDGRTTGSGAQPTAREDPVAERELTALRRQVEFQNKELALSRQRHADLRRAVLQAVGTLKSRSKDGSNDTLIAALERALATSASTGAGVTALDERPAAATPAAATPAMSGNSASGNTAAPGSSTPAAGPTPMPATIRVGAFAFSKIVFAPADGGFTCTGRITNQTMPSMGNDVVTPGFVLTTFDEKGQKIQAATFYVAFSEVDQTKVFSVPLSKAPPTGKFTIELEPAEAK
ncbi:MAG: hypothetical protein NTW19_00975 [Planctomycetota bacterium]|nr:hypothetical protein [Planctomycetota bacterium]